MSEALITFPAITLGAMRRWWLFSRGSVTFNDRIVQVMREVFDGESMVLAVIL